MNTPLLQQLSEACADAVAVLLLRDDGVPIAQVSRSVSTDVARPPSATSESLGPQLVGVLLEVRRTAQVLEYGAMAEIEVSSDRLTLLVRAVGLRHYLALILAPDGNVGRGRFLLRTFGPRLAAVLA
ncbi:MAG: hypothetical protein IPG96_18450 [Proteobacteria bacterium]|nr:hypothetical protein [Pseudomonadota bacterium]